MPFFDGYVNSKTTLKQFVEQFNHALTSKVEKEVREDMKSLSQQLPCVTEYKMEHQIQEVYTIAKFREFQQELVRKMYCEVVNSVGSEHVVREDVKVGEGKKELSLKFTLTKRTVKLIVVAQGYSLREFFAGMPLQP